LIKLRYDPHITSTYSPLGSAVLAGGESQGMPDVINVDTCVVRLVRRIEREVTEIGKEGENRRGAMGRGEE
jgi:hypothetical protein